MPAAGPFRSAIGLTAPTSPVLLFSYGTLQQESVQRATFGWRLPGVADALPGYARTRLEITDPDGLAARDERFPPFVSASADPDAAVAGTLPARTAAELGAADRHEVAACRRVACTRRSGRQAWVYVRA